MDDALMSGSKGSQIEVKAWELAEIDWVDTILSAGALRDQSGAYTL